ncbi:leucine-rich repeat domain-containing protein [Mangrovivirga cuniculi]|uniref:Disease resistance R13L4/SHOC-2-like LRR domain-containing protein n=1 Tax=Mangrovivirga cuniculi TaxID=2715131 RepID=A0A4D7JWW4_9BACT|nr:leucine-rich repeat domain-containing protein [Mangrovivirga cuniculi]QCK16616.1 hypothetical protein DCC35_18710 [Mangrovivirga cuniculi]
MEELVIIAKGVTRTKRTVGQSVNGEELFDNISMKFKSYSSFEEALSHNMIADKLAIIDKGLDKIPANINRFVNLKTLDLEKNNIQELPIEFTQLKKLEEFYIPFNLLSDLPEGFSEMHNLNVIGLGENKFKDFPIELTELDQLQMLDLSGNDIAEVPEEIGQMKNLKLLSLNDTNINTLPDTIFDLKKLRALYLIGTQIPEEEIKRLKENLKNVEVIVE